MHTAIILAAGAGRGAWPYSGLRQKVTLPVAQTPVVRRLSLQLRDLGVKDIVVVVGHGAGAVRACTADISGVRYCEQAQAAGCGDATLAGLAAADAEHVLVCAGDIVTSSRNIRMLVAASADAETTILAVPNQQSLAVWDGVSMDDAGAVSGLWNKGGRQLPRFGGMVVARANVLRDALERSPGFVDNVGVGAMPRAENSLAAALNRMCSSGHTVQGVLGTDFLVDINRPWDLVEANRQANQMLFAERQGVVLAPDARIDDSAEISDSATLLLGVGARIGKGVVVHGDLVMGDHAQAVHGAILGERVNLGRHCVAREYARLHDDTVVGERNLVGHCAEFAGVSFENTLFWHYCCVTAAVGAYTDIGAATCCGTWRFDDSVREQQVGEHRERPPYHGGMAFLGDRIRTGVNVAVNPGVRIGGYSCIGPGVILYDDVPDGQLILAKQEHIVRPWGPERYNW